MRMLNRTLHLDAGKAGKEEQCSYYMWKQKFPVKPECHVKKREEVDIWIITLAFPQGQRLGGPYSPGVFAFLPTGVVTNFPFIIQADFLLASSRETILFDSPWNKGILECVPSAFINAFAELVKSTSDAPTFSLPPIFKFLPVQVSGLQLFDSVRLSIKNKVLEEHMIPSETYNKQKIFCKPGEVRRLTSQFWDILDKAQKSGVDLQSISSHGPYVLSSCFDTKEFDDVLGFLGIGFVDWDWYPKCIEGCDLVREAPDEVYMMLLYFVAEQYVKLIGSKIRNIPLLKYEDVSGVTSIFSINEVTLRGLRVCIASDEKLISWLINWNRELSCISNHFFMPQETQSCLKGFCKSATVMDWLKDYGNMEVLTAYKHCSAVSKAVNDRRLAIIFAHFLYHLSEKGYIDKPNIKKICESMPVVDNYGTVTHWSRVLVPAKGSKWASLMGSNPWRSENYVELSKEYMKHGNFAGNYTPENALLIFIQNNTGAADVPYIHPPNARFPSVSSPLTKENALLLLQWIRHLRSGGNELPNKFLDCVKSGSWLKTSSGYKPPVGSFLSSEAWGSLLQVASDMVDIPMIDQKFYDDVLPVYKNELQLIGVKFEFGEASEFVGEHLMSRLENGKLTRSNVLSLLSLIRFLREKYLSPSQLIEAVQNHRWLRTCLGYVSPTEAFLFSSEWTAASCIVNLPFIDETYYGQSILGYQSELELLGVHVKIGDASNYCSILVRKLKFPPNLCTPEAFLLLLKCIHHVGLTENCIEKIKQSSVIKTNLGFRLLTKSVLPVPKWDCLLTVLDNIPVINVQFYGDGAIRSYGEELRKLGVAVQSEEVSKVVSNAFTQLVSSSSIEKDKVLLILESYRQLRWKQSAFPVDLFTSMKKEKSLQTKMGFQAPRDSVLFNSDWDSISSIATVPFIEYSSDVEEYKDELGALGVAITPKNGAGFVLKGINLPTDPTTVTPRSSLLLLKCIKYWNKKKPDLPKEFKDRVRKKWLKTVLGYRCPDESLFYDSKYSSLIQRGDGPFIDENFYGAKIGLYRDQLKGIGVEVDIRCGCSLVARHLICHSERSTIVRIYKFLQEFEWEPENENFSWIWVPGEEEAGEWVFPENCVLRDNSNLFASQLHILDKFYEEDLLGFFSKAFNVKDEPDIEDYVKLWVLWENSASKVSLEDCLVFWEFIGLHWNLICEKLLAKHVQKLPVLIGGSISLICKQDLFIPDDLLLEDLFDKSLFVWYPTKSTPSLPRLKLTRIYTSLGVRNFSEAVMKHEASNSDTNGSDNGTKLESSANVITEGLIRIILAFLANPCLDISAKERHEIVESLLDLTIVKADEPVNMKYRLELSGGRLLEAKATHMFRWEKNEARLFMPQIDGVQGMVGSIKYATYLSDVISQGLLYERADLVESLAELIKFGCLLNFELAAVEFLLKNKNLQVFAEDEEFLLLHFSTN
ncbi:ATP/DNA binding protein [Rhynchospora pubera]|uniref:ATP/DNA binding protein n=1 Tax=Rhynchospora pubera TaxID=906938 RepID=A0AAV8BVW1_9POAL|nr:ATP/DNA binding protein [Rhynchospora pubera]